jgi:hypothetical protein
VAVRHGFALSLGRTGNASHDVPRDADFILLSSSAGRRRNATTSMSGPPCGPMFACIDGKESGIDRKDPGGDNAR